ncbi:MAG TPA: YggS family pyridoxal phosphate-dependent enzyme [Thermodesulfobacteriota bacterium]|nr:YggS family pyridoxal phosphate-dependent enzyme [Thermodesulfobacteriota bacterium]
MTDIADNLSRIRERIAAAALRAGRRPEDVRLVAVSKTVEPERIRQAMDAGVKILGENYVQEAQKKIESLGHGVEWHFIGHLQTNKAKVVVRLFHFFHSVDSPKLAQELNRVAAAQKKRLPVLIEVNLAREESKFGTGENEIMHLLESISPLQSISVRGLMTMPPYFDDPEESRPYFRRLRALAESIRQKNIPGVSMQELSMGMSNDFEPAIEEGATMVRIGTAIFGARPRK